MSIMCGRSALVVARARCSLLCAIMLACGLWTSGPFFVDGNLNRQLQMMRLPRGWELREALEVLDKELYDHAPGPERPYIPAIKNPCWPAPGRDDGSVHCLPYAMVIGGFQCGGASLWQALYRHPMVAKSDVSRWHFWAEFDKSMAAYIDGMSKASARIMAWPPAVEAATKAAASGGGGGGGGWSGVDVGGPAWLKRQQKIILDGSSSTFAFYWSPNVRAHRAFVKAMVPCWDGCHRAHKDGPERQACLGECYGRAGEADRRVATQIGIPYNDISLPLLMSAVYGRRPPKMVVLVRNPVDRLYSAYWRYGHYRDKYGPSAEGFETYAREQLSALRACMARNGSESAIGCILHFETWGLTEERLYFHADQLLRGLYSVWLEIWLKFFDRKDILVLRSEDYFADPVDVYGRVLEWLGLDASAIDYHTMMEKLGKATTPEQAAEAMKAPVDDKLWTEIRKLLLEGERGLESRFEINRKAALEAQEKPRGKRQGGGAAGGGRPPMSNAIRKELADFYAPYNRRLAELMQDPNFVKNWD